jgi:predicted dinucleotide-binding enzyme
MTSIGIIGAGHIGSQVARVAATAGFDVVVSNSQGPASLAGLAADLVPHGRAGTVAEAAAADVVVVAGLLQGRLPGSRVVKAFSHLSAADLTTDGRPAGTPDRRALAVAGDDPEAKQFVAALYDRAGFDAVDIGGLDQSWRIGMGQPAFVTRQNAEQLRANVARARR